MFAALDSIPHFTEFNEATNKHGHTFKVGGEESSRELSLFALRHAESETMRAKMFVC